MNHPGLRLVFLLVLGWASPLVASFAPTFSVEDSTWHATDIVLVTEIGQKSGQVKVLEAWKGNVRAGEILNVPGLAAFDPETARAVAPSFRFESETPAPAVHVTGSNLVLFLKDEAGDWQPANMWNDLRVAAVWIEGEKSYSFLQLTRPGASELRELSQSRVGLKGAVDGILNVQNGLARAARMKDPAQHAQALVPFANVDGYWARDAVYKSFAQCGPAAVPALRALLNDPGMLPRYQDIVEAMGKAGGKSVGAELTQMLRGETAFWRKTAPSLQAGWWNGKGLPGFAEVEPLRDRYCRTLAIVRALTEMDDDGDLTAVVELRDYWVSLPQLCDKSGLDQMSSECDQLLKSASQPAGEHTER